MPEDHNRDYDKSFSVFKWMSPSNPNG